MHAPILRQKIVPLDQVKDNSAMRRTD